MSNQDAASRPGGGDTPRGATGCRTHKPEYDRAREAADAWTGREGGLDHWTLLEHLEAEGVPEHFGLRTRHIDYVRLSFRKLGRADFEPGGWPPVVWMSKHTLARKLRVSPRAVSDIEKDLARAGFLYWTDTASRRRDGKRSRQDGRISWAYGVDFSPFDALAGDIESVARLVEDEQVERDGLVHQIATIRCHTRILLQAALRRDQASAAALRPLLDQVLSLPPAKAMACLDIHALRALADEARAVRDRADALAGPRRAGPEEPSAAPPDSPDSAASETGKGVEICTLGYAPEAGSNSITDQFQGNTLVAADPTDEPSPEPARQPAARQGPEREAGSPAQAGIPPVAGGPPGWLVLDSLSPRLGRHLPAGRVPAEEEFVDAAGRTRSELGISPEAWREACTALSPVWAALAVAIVASRDDAGEIHTSAGGYFRKLTKRGREGTLNLAGSLWGVIERHEQLHADRVTAPTDPRPDPNRQRADPATMEAICRTAADPEGLYRAWRELVARYSCWPFVDEVERQLAAPQSPFA